KSLCAVVLKGHWDTILKPRIGTSLSSSFLSQALLVLLPSQFWISWSFFKWIETVPRYKLSLQSYWVVVCVLAQRRRFETARDILHKLAVREFLSSPPVLNAVVDTYHDPYIMAHVLSWLVIFYANSKMNPDSLQVFEHMIVCGYKPHLHACTVLLNSLVKERLTDTVWKTYKKMLRVGVVPNLYIYNVLIHACCKSGDVKRAEELFSELELHRISPDLFTYNTLISLYCKRGMHYEALCVQDRMERGGVSPDIVTWNSIIYSYCKGGRMREALRIFNEIKGVASPNHVTYTTLIDGYCRVDDLDAALQLLDTMEAKQLYPGVVTYNAIIRKLCQDGRMREANRLLTTMSDNRVEPDLVTCNTLINAYCKIGDMTSALKVKGKMSEAGLKPDQYTYNALIHGFSRSMDIDSAKATLFNMLSDGYTPSHCTYSWIVDFYCTRNDANAILNLPGELTEKGLCVNDNSVYRAFIRRLCKKGEVVSAVRVFRDMKRREIVGDSVIFTNLAYAFWRNGDARGASSFFDEMHERRLMVTVKIFRSMEASYGSLPSFWEALVGRGLISKATQKQI
ncbi:hypothetical protein M569_07017, partial [Genlisea aurea]